MKINYSKLPFGLIIPWWNIAAFQNIHKTGFSSYVSSKDSPRTVLHSPVTTPLPDRTEKMNFFKGRKKKRGKKTKAMK